LLSIDETLLGLGDPGEKPSSPFGALSLGQTLEALLPSKMDIQQVRIVRQSEQDFVVVAYHSAGIFPG
jgi:hypothetical protein